MGGRTASSIPKIPSPAPNHTKTLGFMDTQNAEFRGSNSCRNRSAYLGPARCAYTGQRRSRTWQSHRAAPEAFQQLQKEHRVVPARALFSQEGACCGQRYAAVGLHGTNP